MEGRGDRGAGCYFGRGVGEEWGRGAAEGYGAAGEGVDGEFPDYGADLGGEVGEAGKRC